MTKRIATNGHYITTNGRSATMSKRADRACGLHRLDFSWCSDSERAVLMDIKAAIRDYARSIGVHSLDLYTHEGVMLETVEVDA